MLLKCSASMDFRLSSPIIVINNNKSVSARFMRELLITNAYFMIIDFRCRYNCNNLIFFPLQCFLSTFLMDNHILEILFTDEGQTEYVQMTLSIHTHKLKAGKRASTCAHARTHTGSLGC